MLRRKLSKTHIAQLGCSLVGDFVQLVEELATREVLESVKVCEHFF
jgi:hypothetical protein